MRGAKNRLAAPGATSQSERPTSVFHQLNSSMLCSPADLQPVRRDTTLKLRPRSLIHGHHGNMLRRVHRQLKAEDTLQSSHDIWWIVRWADVSLTRLFITVLTMRSRRALFSWARRSMMGSRTGAGSTIGDNLQMTTRQWTINERHDCFGT